MEFLRIYVNKKRRTAQGERTTDKEIEVHSTETETQQTIANDGRMKEKECATTSENAAVRNKEVVSDKETVEMNFELESRTLNRRRRMKKVVQINLEQVKKQKLRKEAKARLNVDRKDL